ESAPRGIPSEKASPLPPRASLIVRYGIPVSVFRAGLLTIALVCVWVLLVVASGRTSGVVKNTPSGVGLGVGVTIVCGEPAAPERSWMRISRAKSSCTVLWQWLT